MTKNFEIETFNVSHIKSLDLCMCRGEINYSFKSQKLRSLWIKFSVNLDCSMDQNVVSRQQTIQRGFKIIDRDTPMKKLNRNGEENKTLKLA